MFNPRFSRSGVTAPQTKTQIDAIVSNRGVTELVQNNILGDNTLRVKIANEGDEDHKGICLFLGFAPKCSVLSDKKKNVNIEVLSSTGFKIAAGVDITGIPNRQNEAFHEYFKRVPTTFRGVEIVAEPEVLRQAISINKLEPSGNFITRSINLKRYMTSMGGGEYQDHLRIDDFEFTTLPIYSLVLERLPAGKSIELEFNIVSYTMSAINTEQSKMIL